MPRVAGAEHEDGPGGEDQDQPDAFDDPRQKQHRRITREGAGPARRRDQHKARYDRAAMTEAVGERTDCWSDAHADQTDHRRDDAGGDQPERQVVAQCRQRGGHLADLKRGHRAGEGREPDQAPARRRRHRVGFEWTWEPVLRRCHDLFLDCGIGPFDPWEQRFQIGRFDRRPGPDA